MQSTHTNNNRTSIPNCIRTKIQANANLLLHLANRFQPESVFSIENLFATPLINRHIFSSTQSNEFGPDSIENTPEIKLKMMVESKIDIEKQFNSLVKIRDNCADGIDTQEAIKYFDLHFNYSSNKNYTNEEKAVIIWQYAEDRGYLPSQETDQKLISEEFIRAYNADPNAKSLDFRYYKLKMLPSTLFNCSTLEELDLSENSLRSISEKITKLSKLHKLDLSKNLFNQFPDSITNIETLKQLELSYNDIETLPKTIENFKTLENLTLCESKINTLPKEIGKIKTLKAMNIAFNKNLTHLPVEIAELKELSGFFCFNTNLSFIPKEMGDLTNLETLILSGNKLNSIPDTISKLTNLNLLSFEGNQITSFDSLAPLVKQDSNPNATKLLLDISNNSLKFQPSWHNQHHLKTLLIDPNLPINDNMNNNN